MTIPNDQKVKPLRWEFHHFGSLDTTALFALMKLRVDVFVVEQACAYPELDDADTAPETIHLLGHAGAELAAYARAMPGGKHAPASQLTPSGTVPTTVPPIRIGRVVIARPWRGQGLATALMQELMSHLQLNFPGRDHCLAAQASVQALYAALGFVPVSEVYLEDGIPHVDMVRRSGFDRTASTPPDA